MPLINEVVTSLEKARPPQPVDLVLTDGDGTIFPHGSDKPFPGALSYLDALEPNYLALVSADSNRELAEARKEVMNADAYFIPRFNNPVKPGLFNRAINAALEATDVQSVAVLGDRWTLDVVSARIVLCLRGINNIGVTVRQEPSPQIIDRILTGPLESICYDAITLAGLDYLIRQREVIVPNPGKVLTPQEQPVEYPIPQILSAIH